MNRPNEKQDSPSDNTKMAIKVFTARLEEAANILLNLLQKSIYYKVQLSSITVLCEVACFFQCHSDFRQANSQQVGEIEDPRVQYSDKQCKNRRKLSGPELDSNPPTIQRETRASQRIKNYRIRSKRESTYTSHVCQENVQQQEHTGKESDADDNICVDSVLPTASDLQCSYCYKQFIDRRNLKSHLWVHERTKSFQCEVCQKCFLRSHQLTRHKRVHTGEKPYSCAECGKTFADVSNLNTHRRKDHESCVASLLRCEECGKEYQNANELRVHLLTSHNREASTEKQVSKVKESLGHRPPTLYLHEPRAGKSKLHGDTEAFLCQVCGKSLNKRAALLAHMKRHICKKDFRCEFCNKVFPELRELKIHHVEHTGDRPYTCDMCGKGFKSQGTLRSHKGVHSGDQPYSCDVCGQAFSQTSGLNQHKLKHTADEEKKYGGSRMDNQNSCDICGRCYKTKFRLQLHLRSHGNRDVSCDFCEKKFQTAQDLTVHRRSHTKDKYSCRVCGESFKSRSVYYFHTRTHQIDRPHLCSTCGKSFTSSNDLNAHKRRHTIDGSIFTKSHEQFICNVCGKIYQTKNSLIVHMKIHQGIFDHPCDFCEKKFKSHAELRHHRRVHTQEKPYACETCSRHFSRHSTLVNHRRTHSGERPYMCTICGAAFKLSCTLKKHARTHAREAHGWKGRPGKAKPATQGLTQQFSIQEHHILQQQLQAHLPSPHSSLPPDQTLTLAPYLTEADVPAQTHQLHELKPIPASIKVHNPNLFHNGGQELLGSRKSTHNIIIQELVGQQQQNHIDENETTHNLIEMSNDLANPSQCNTGANTVTEFYYY